MWQILGLGLGSGLQVCVANPGLLCSCFWPVKRGEKERGLQIYVASRKERAAALVGIALEVSVESTTWPVKKGKEERKCS